jgi:hypothetical protein
MNAEQHSRNQNRADEGAGRGPGGPPHESSQAAKKLMDRSPGWSIWLWGRMSSCARLLTAPAWRQLEIGAQVGNLPHV